MMTSTVRKFGVGVASLALVAGMAVPALAAEINLPNGLKVDTDKQRYAGDGRVETALAVAKAAWKDKENDASVAYLVGYDGLVDAATAGMLDNGSDRGPVVALPQDLKEQKLYALALKKAFPKLKKLVAVGGTTVVTDESLKAVAETAGISKTDRLGGADRYETNMAIARKVFPSPSRVYMTRGDLMVDAVSSGTLEKGAIVLLPHSGDVPDVVKNYVTAANPADVVVIGGEEALNDEQVSKAFKSSKKIETTPWTAPEVISALQAKVQTYAALYFGQNWWQTDANKGALNMTKKEAALPYAHIDPAQVDDDDKPTTPKVPGKYWALGGTGLTGFTNAVQTEDPTDISVMAPMVDGANAQNKTKYFGGYSNIAKKAQGASDKLAEAGNILALKQALDTAVRTAIDNNETFNHFQDPNGHGQAVINAVKALYSARMISENPIAVKDGKIADAGIFKFDNNDASNSTKFVGLNMEVINDQVAADKASSDKFWDNSGQDEGSDLTIADIAKRDATDLAALYAARNTDTTNTKTNWIAIQQLVDARLADFKQRAADSKESLVNAVRDYHAAQDLNGSSRSSTSGYVRIQGKDRYETSALVSIFQSKTTGDPTDTVGEDRKADMAMQYLASGNDANLIDAVFAGQLKKGTILLVPSQGELNDLVMLELKRKGTPKYASTLGEGIFASQIFTVGGKQAVSDEVFVAAVNAMAGK